MAVAVRVAAIQHDIAWEDPPATFARLRPWIAAAAGAGARLVVLPEMFSTGFSMDADRVAEAPDGPSTSFLAEEAARHGVWMCASVPVRDHPGELPANVCTLAGPSGQLHRYAKIHPFSYAGEHEHYRAGTELVTVDVEGVRASLFVCYDLRFADEFWQLAVRTDVYVVVANWPERRRRHWQALLPARAIENQAYVIGVNRVGADGGGVMHMGDSMIIDPLGEVLASAAGSEALLVAEVDPAVVTAVRERYPFLADRKS